MKNITKVNTIFFFLSFWPLLSFGQLTLNPKVEKNSHPKNLKINHVALMPESTVIEVTYTHVDAGIVNVCAASSFFIKGSHESSKFALKLKETKNIPICPKQKSISKLGESMTFELIFPRLKPGYEIIDIIEEYSSGNAFTFHKVHIRNPGPKPVVDPVELEAAKAEMSPEKDASFKGKKLKINDEVKLDISFDKASYLISSNSSVEIEKVANMLKKFKRLRVKLEGHTESDKVEYTPRQCALNVKLSTQRVLEVRNALIKLGVNPKQITYKGFGGTLPVSKSDESQNRRVMMRILSIE